jgi:proteasome lid subunit RPN8/RPN11
MLGRSDTGDKVVELALRMENVQPGSQRERYELDGRDLLAADAEARRRGLDVIGIYHSHPDCDAYFSQTDLKNSCPWYSFVVLSVREGRYHHANSWLPDADQTKADREDLILPEN